MADKKLLIKLAADVENLKKGLRDASSKVDSFSGSLKKAGVALAGFISAREIGSFVLQVSRLAGEAAGVSAAFQKLPDSAKLMRDLESATGGTVSQLDLMKRSVMASNFDISLKALPQLLEFATLRARQTGQSVDYLVDSIVTGIGRKSKLILDNLGISAVQLTEALGGASAASSSIGDVAEAVGKIASENLKKMGKLTDDAAVKADRLIASWANLKVTIGEGINNAGLSKVLEVLDYMLGGGDHAAQALQSLRYEIRDFNKGIGQFNDGGEKITKRMAEMSELAKSAGVQVKFLTEQANGATKAIIAIPNKNLVWINGEETKKQVRNITFLEEQIKSLTEEIKLTTKPTDIQRWQKEIVALQREIDTLMSKVKKVKLDFSGLAGKNTALPKVEGKNFGLMPDFAKKMMEGLANDAKEFKRISKLVDGARGSFESFGISTKKGLAQASEAFTQFLKDGNIDDFNHALLTISENETKVRNLSAEIWAAIGQGFGDAVSGAKSFAKAMGDMARQVIGELKRMALAYMIANSAKFGLGAIIAAGVGFSIVESLFNRIGEKNNGSNAMNVAPRSTGRDNIMAGGFSLRVAGTDLIAVLDNTNRQNGRTRGFNLS